MTEKQNYNTKARRFILEYLESCGDTTVSAADILQYLKGLSVSVNLTTVYRYLNKLTREKRLVKIVDEKGNKAVYQLVGHKKSCDEHIHIQCSNCGKLVHLDCGFMDDFKNHILKEHGFKLKCSGSVLYGLCAECRNKT